jgi:hypothetical protein
VTVPQAQQNNNKNAGGNAGSQFGRRRIGAINSGLRKQSIIPINNSNQIASINTKVDDGNLIYGALELDSHADTACIGPECRILSVTEKVCHVNAYHPGYDAFEEIPIVQATTAYDDPETSVTTYWSSTKLFRYLVCLLLYLIQTNFVQMVLLSMIYQFIYLQTQQVLLIQ